MKTSSALLVFTPAAFAAGFLALRLWPAADPVSTPAAANSAALSPSHISDSPYGGGPPPPESRIASRLDAKKRAALLSPEEARTIIERLPDTLDEEQRAWLTAVLLRWAKSDPSAAIAWLQSRMKTKGAFPDWPALLSAELARRDLPAALIALGSMSGRYSDPEGVLAAAAERDPAAVMEYAEQNRQLSSATVKAFRVWLQKDPATACAWLNTRRLSDQYPAERFLQEVMRLAPDRLTGLLAQMPKDSDAKKRIEDVLAVQEIERDPAAALTKFFGLTDAERLRMLNPLGMHLATRGTPSEVAAVFKQCSGDARTAFLGALGSSLFGGDGERLLAMARLPDLLDVERAQLMTFNPLLKPAHAEELMAIFSRAPGFKDNATQFWTLNLQGRPAETLPVLQRMIAEGKVDANLLLMITNSQVQSGVSAAEKIIAALPENQRTGPRAVLEVRTALSGGDAGLTVFRSLPEDERHAALQTVFRAGYNDFGAAKSADFLRQLPATEQIKALSVMVVNPPEVEAFLPLVATAARSDPGGAETSDVVTMLVARMDDFTAASQWLDTLPSGAAQDGGRMTAFLNYATTDIVAASSWLAAQPADAPQRDAFTGELAIRVVNTDPERAWQWAATIQDETRRREAQQSILTKWRTTDPAAANKAAGE